MAGGPESSPPAYVRFGTACGAGLMSWTLVHPLNTISVRRNLATLTQPQPQPDRSLTAFISNLLRQDGVRGLYAGLSAGYTRQVYYTTCQVGLFETLRDEVIKYRQLDLPTRLAVGCTSGAIAAAVSCPAEVALVRMTNDATLCEAQQRRYRNVLDAGLRIAREEGVLRLFSGCGPFVWRAILVGAFQIGTFDHFKHWFASMGVTSQFGNVAAASFGAGFVYSVVTMPFETAKNRLAFQRPDAVTGKRPFTGAVSAMRSVLSTQGVRGLWAGFVPYYTRCSVFSVGMFVSLEWLRHVVSRSGAR